MKKIIPFVFLLTLFGCTSKDPILGTWERHGDELKGMRLKVTQNSSAISAELIKLPESGDTTFTLGDTKWRDIKKVDNGKYVFGDLSKYVYSYGSLFQNRYEDSYLTIVGDNIKTRGFAKADEIVGTEQIWKRVAE